MLFMLQHSLLGIGLTLCGLLMLLSSIFNIQLVSFFLGVFLLCLVIIQGFIHFWHHKRLIQKLCLEGSETSPLVTEIRQSCSFILFFPFHHLLPYFLYKLEFVASVPSRSQQKFIFKVHKFSKSSDLSFSFSWRGCYSVKTYLEICDIFGLFYSRIQLPNTLKILVAPISPKIENCSISPVILNDLYQNCKSYKIEKSREYYPGDHLHRIHWGQSSRFKKLFVREIRSHPKQEKIENEYYVLFVPPLNNNASGILDHLIQEMLKMVTLRQTVSSQIHIILGSLLLKTFQVDSLIQRSQLSYAYAGMPCALNDHYFSQKGTWTFWGCTHDKNFAKAIQQYYSYVPKIFFHHPSLIHDENFENFTYLTRTLNLKTYHV